MAFRRLFSPGKINQMTIKNRIIFPPMGTGLLDFSEEPNEKLIELFARRARGGVGLLISEQLFTEVPSAATANLKVNIMSPRLGLTQPRYRDWVEAVQPYGARLCAGLTPLPGRWFITMMKDKSKRREDFEAAATQGMSLFNDLSTGEIEDIIANYARAAGHLKNYGFDAIEVCFTYLCDYFSKKQINKRTDKYRFAAEDGLAFSRDLIQETRKAVGPDFPIMFFIDADQYTPGFRTIEDTKRIAVKLEKWGIDSIRCRAGTSVKMQYDCIPPFFPKGAIVHLAEAVKKVVKIPVVANGRIFEPELAESILTDGKADFVVVGRALLADPDLPNKWKAGQADRVRKCLSCNIGCLGTLMGNPVFPFRCTVNPTVGIEEQFRDMRPAMAKKKVVVVGAGPGGMSAALTAAQRGHRVVLIEKAAELGGGGFMKLATLAPFKQENAYVAEYYQREFPEYKNLEVRLNTVATPKLVLAEKPDAVIIATGAHWELPAIPGADSPGAVIFDHALQGKKRVGKRVVIIGGGETACDTALFLAKKGRQVTMLARSARLAQEIPLPNRNCLMEELEKSGVKQVFQVAIKRVDGKQVSYLKDGKEATITGDTIILGVSVGGAPLYDELSAKVTQAYLIGDAEKPRRIMEAVREGFLVAYYL